MKANKAPEKIYVHVKDDKVCNTWNSVWTGVNDIEYTRTDAFIEKAENFLQRRFDVEDYNDILDIDSSPIFNYGRFIEDFINYVKGE